MSVSRFFSAWRWSGDAFFRRRSASAVAGDELLWEQLNASVVGRTVRRLSELRARAASESVALNRIRECHRGWDTLSPLQRLRMIGIAVCAAVAIHLAMTGSQNGFVAWRLILPGLAGVFGLVALILSFLGPRRTGSSV